MPLLSKAAFAELMRRMPEASNEDILSAARELETGQRPAKKVIQAGAEVAPKAAGSLSAAGVGEALQKSPINPMNILGAPASALREAISTVERDGLLGAIENAGKRAVRTALGQNDPNAEAFSSLRVVPSAARLPEGSMGRKVQDVLDSVLSFGGRMALNTVLDPLSWISPEGRVAEEAAPVLRAGRSASRAVQGSLFPEAEAAAAESGPAVRASGGAIPPSPTPAKTSLASVPETGAPSKLAAYHSPLPKYIAEQFERGKEGADWYAKAMPDIQRMLGPDAEKIIDYFAATSPNATVKANTGFAVKALEQDKAGEPFTGYLGQSIDRLNKAKAGEAFGGPKVSAFTRALKGDPNAVVVDRWIARHWGIDKPTSTKQYNEIADQIRQHAQTLGIEPRQLQAALWVAAKKNWGRPGDTAAPFEDVLKEMIGQRSLFNPEGLTRKFAPEDAAAVEPPLFTGSQMQKYASEIGALTKQTGGATYNLRKGDLGGTEAFAVSAFPEREVVIPPGKGLGPKEIAGFIDKNQDLLKDPRVSFGSWVVSPEDASPRYPAGSTVLGLSATPTDLRQARGLAKNLGEEQLFDLKNFKTLPTFVTKAEGQALPDIASRLDGLTLAELKDLVLEHRSDTGGLTELDPSKVKIQPTSSEYARSINYQGKFPARSFFTRAGGAVENAIQERPFVYDASVPESRLYDIGADPEGLIPLARTKAQSEWGDTSGPAWQTMLEKMIHDSGYSGMFNSKHPMKEMADTVVMFNKVPATMRATSANPELRSAAEHYITQNGLARDEFAPRVTSLNPKNMEKVANAFAALEHRPNDPAVQASYGALKNEVVKQFNLLQHDLGFKLVPWTKPGQPYANSAEMMNDVRNNKRLFFFTGGDMPADHPLAEVDPKTGLTYNDMFRAVHDIFGHAKEGFQFGPVGEENAFRTHARMFSPEARGALATETKGQNSYVNFGPGKDLPVTQRPYAEQKAAILPKAFHTLSALVGPALAAALLQKLSASGDTGSAH